MIASTSFRRSRSSLAARSTRSTSATRAFTLIELLTVIAIIAIIAAIIFPVVGKVRESAKASVCQSNLRLWGTATALYLSDNKNKLPSTEYKNVIILGSTIASDAYLSLNRYMLAPTVSSYMWGYNQTILEPYTCTNRGDSGNGLTWAAYGFSQFPSEMKITAVGNPSAIIWATESAGGGGGQRWIPTGIYSTWPNLGGAPIKPHGARNNLLFLDGHVEARAMKDVVKADFSRGTPFYNAADETNKMGI